MSTKSKTLLERSQIWRQAPTPKTRFYLSTHFAAARLLSFQQREMEDFLAALLSPDNAVRREAENAFAEAKKDPAEVSRYNFFWAPSFRRFLFPPNQLHAENPPYWSSPHAVTHDAQ